MEEAATEIVKDPPAACVGDVRYARRAGPGAIGSTTGACRQSFGNLRPELGRRFRHFLWKGLRIAINGEQFGPLIRSTSHRDASDLGRAPLRRGAPLRGPRRRPTHGRPAGCGSGSTELPVHEWHRLSNEEKRRIRRLEGRGRVDCARRPRGRLRLVLHGEQAPRELRRLVAVRDPVRSGPGRGLRHHAHKQQVRPQTHLIEALTPDLEADGTRAERPRAEGAPRRQGGRVLEAERVANERDHLLRPLPTNADPKAKALMRELEKNHPALRRESNGAAVCHRRRP